VCLCVCVYCILYIVDVCVLYIAYCRCMCARMCACMCVRSIRQMWPVICVLARVTVCLFQRHVCIDVKDASASARPLAKYNTNSSMHTYFTNSTIFIHPTMRALLLLHPATANLLSLTTCRWHVPSFTYCDMRTHTYTHTHTHTYTHRY